MIYKSQSQQILLDSDFIFGLLNSGDSNHEKSVEMLNKIEKFGFEITLLNLVKQESATLISRRIDHATSLSCLKFLDEFEQVFVTEKLELTIWDFFKSFTKKNISFIDCANLVLAKEFNYKIASFDEFYPQEFRLI